MKTPELFKEYIWLLNTIYQAGKMSFTDINVFYYLCSQKGND
jgi:hypothetical protein